MPRDLPPDCTDCGRTGVRIVKQKSEFYVRAGSKVPDGEVDVAIPCKCRLRNMVVDWLRPLTIQYSTGWAEKHKSLIDSDILGQLDVEKNILVDGSLYGCCFYFVKALMAYLGKRGMSGWLPYVATNDMEMRAWYWEHEQTQLDSIDWEAQKLIIILVGQLRMKTGGNSSQLISTRIAQANALGNRVWLGYHSLSDRSDKANINWSGELEDTIGVYDFNRVKLNSPFDRRSDHDTFGGASRPLMNGNGDVSDKYDQDVDADL